MAVIKFWKIACSLKKVFTCRLIAIMGVLQRDCTQRSWEYFPDLEKKSGLCQKGKVISRRCYWRGIVVDPKSTNHSQLQLVVLMILTRESDVAYLTIWLKSISEAPMHSTLLRCWGDARGPSYAQRVYLSRKTVLIRMRLTTRV